MDRVLSSPGVGAMTQAMAIALLVILVALVTLVMYTTATFTYEMEESALLMRWRVLRYLPFSRLRIPLERIVEVKRFRSLRDLGSCVRFFCTIPLRGRGVVMRLDKGLVRRVLITPGDPDAFLRIVEPLLRARRAT